MKKLIIIALSVALLSLCVVILGIFWFSFQQINFSGVTFRPVSVGAEATEEKILDVNGPVTLEVNISYGSITINAANVDTVTITMDKTAYAESQAEAEEELRNMQVDLTQNGSNIQVVFEQPKGIYMDVGKNQADRVDLTIQVPAETEVTAYSGSGDVSISGAQAMTIIESGFGDLHASNITGSLNASTTSGKVEAIDIQSGEAGIDLKSGYGNIRLEISSAGTIQVNSGSGSLELKNVDASSQMTLHSNYGGIVYAGGSAQSLTITAGSGRVDLANLEIFAGLNATSNYGDLHLEQVAAGSYDLETSSGNVTVEEASGTITAYSGYGNIEITGGEDARLDINMPWNHCFGKENLPGTNSAERIAHLEAQMQSLLDDFCKSIVAREPYLQKDADDYEISAGMKWFDLLVPKSMNYKAHEYMYRNLVHFLANSKCSGCGICAKVCINEKIVLVDKKPNWKEDVPCYACFACINYCPCKAIQVQSRFPIHSYSEVNDRYHHKSVTYKDIADQR